MSLEMNQRHSPDEKMDLASLFWTVSYLKVKVQRLVAAGMSTFRDDSVPKEAE